MTKDIYHIEPGVAHPLGAVPDKHGVNFSLFSKHAKSVELLLFARHDDPEPFQVILLDPKQHRTFHFWYGYVRGLRPGMQYAYRLGGPHVDVHQTGDRFHRNKVVLDPYTRGITTSLWNRADASGSGDNVRTCMRGMVVDLSGYDWEGDRPLNIPMSETVIYELHVGGFTRSPSSGCHSPGTFAGIVEKIPYLQELGITAVELLPVFAFDEQGAPFLNPVDGKPLKNVWGYDPVAHFAPHPAYCLAPEKGSQVRDFREMVKALHRAGIEVILDVVFNHTGEGDHLGPTISFKGIDNSIYYVLDPTNKERYVDYSGCGNTFKCNHLLVVKLITDCLEFWAKDMHVDGFRLDEGSILARGGDGRTLPYPPVLWYIELDEVLADAKLVAEAWDAAGLYQIGSFPGYRWAEWNGRYRDDIRHFVRGEPGMVGVVASRIAGSSDLYQSTGHMPVNSIKNCVAILMLSQGVPMILASDEVRRTQQGNNNAYCQDNELSRFDWKLEEKHTGMFRFFKMMIAFRKSHPNVRRERFLSDGPNEHGVREIDWHGRQLFTPDWHDPNGRILAITIWGLSHDDDLHMMLNMEQIAHDFEIPSLQEKRWLKVIYTASLSPLDMNEPGKERVIPGGVCRVKEHSVVVLISW